MDGSEQKKKDFLNNLYEQLNVFKHQLNSIKEKIDSKEFTNETEILRKFEKLNRCMDNLSWKIHHFEEIDLEIDDLVSESFEDAIDEISWRIAGIELNMEGKHLWDAGEELRRDKNKITEIKESDNNRL